MESVREGAETPGAERELFDLQHSPVWYGEGVPRGDGRLVFPIPGMFGDWLPMQPMYGWLQRIGYETSRAVVSLHPGCGAKLMPPTQMTLTAATQGRPRAVALIGHSGGGLIARALAARLGGRVSHLILLGAPLRAVLDDVWQGSGTSPEGIAAARSEMEEGWARMQEADATCAFPTCGCSFMEDLRRDLAPGTRVLSLYSATDPLNSAWSCHLDGARNVAIRGSHVGLIVNRDVYGAVGRFLAGRR